jgi:hypothetical protein
MASCLMGPAAWNVAKIAQVVLAGVKMLDVEGGAAAGLFLALVHAVGRR